MSIYSKLASLLSAANTKTGESDATLTDAMQTLIDGYGQGGGGLEEKAVNFYDYDGELLYSYTPEEFAELSELPANPTHTGLTAQGWNWTLVDAKAYIAKYPDADLIIGQMYVTSDGNTEIDITLPETLLSPYLRCSVNGTAVIDWGDGSTPDTITGNGSSDIYTLHNYASAGDYTITIEVTGLLEFAQGSNSNNPGVFSAQNTNGYKSNKYSQRITAIRIGANVKFGPRAFIWCSSMKTINIPKGIAEIPDNCFTSCFELKSAIVPDTASLISNMFNGCRSARIISIPNVSALGTGSDGFSNCWSLERFTIPDGITTIYNNIFNNCRELKKIVIPDTVTSIGSGVFGNCTKLKRLVFPDDVTVINGSVAVGCGLITEIHLPDDCTTINGSAFENCTSIRKVTVPKDVTSIAGSSAFNNCQLAREYHFLPTTPPDLNNAYTFNGIDIDCVFYVPYSEDHSILSAYQSATNWSNFASRMVEEQP